MFSISRMKILVSAIVFAVILNGCGTREAVAPSSKKKTKINPVVVPEKPKKSLKITRRKDVLSVKSVLDKKKRKMLLLQAPGIELNTVKGLSGWKLRVDGEVYNLRPYPLIPASKVEIVKDEPGRKVIKMTSKPFPQTNVVMSQEVTAVKGFPGLFFKISQENLEEAPLLRRIETFLSMKNPEYVTMSGSHAAGEPWRRKGHIRNWVFMPNGEHGIGAIFNYSLPKMEFCSTLGRKGHDGERINDPLKSCWGIRRRAQVDPNKSEELHFALVAANSPKITAELCKRVQEEKVFPELKLEKISKKPEKAPKTEKVKVEPILNPAKYSAEKLDAKSIDEWVKKEIDPEKFDIWFGKKDREYLNGSWKFIKLEGTSDKPKCDYGIQHGFEKADFNDSKWFNQPVPYMWNIPFTTDPTARPKRRLGFGGVGWYRKKFFLPENKKAERVILHFEAVDQETQVFVNGEKVTSHKTINIDKPSGIVATQQAFEVDITGQVEFGQENSIAIRIYDNGEFSHSWKKNNPKGYEILKKMCSGVGGIWQEVYLDFRPPVYLKQGLCSFDVKNSELSLKAFVVNSGKSQIKEKLSLELSPWRSKRYTLAEGKSQSHKLGEFTLKPGLNILTLKSKIDDPLLWSPENPYLYELALKNDKGTILGKERVGLRQFTVGKNYFYLNGEKISLRGQQCAWNTWSNAPGNRVLANQMGVMNRRHALEDWLKKYKKMNHNIVRNHSSFYPHCFYDISDELGIMIYAGHYFKEHQPFFDENARMTDFYRSKIKAIAEESRRFPSVVMLSMKNEPYDSHLLGHKIDNYKPYFEQIYKAFKEYAPELLLSACGRPPTEESMLKTKTAPYAYAKTFTPTDFYAVHNYQMCWFDTAFAEDDDWSYGLEKFRDAYFLDAGPKPMWNTESTISSIIKPVHGHSHTVDKQFRPHVKDGMIDRKWFVDNWKLIPPQKYGTIALDRSVPKFGFLDTVLRDRSPRTQAGFMKRITELHRRKRDVCAGVVGNDPQIFHGGKTLSDMSSPINEPVAQYTQKANQPVLACFDEKWNRNIFSGDNPPTPLYLMNDHEKTITEAKVMVSLEALDHNAGTIPLEPVLFAKLAPGEMKTIPYAFKLAKNAPSGHYNVVLKVSYVCQGKKRESLNDYKTYVLNRGDIKLKSAPSVKIALYAGTGSEVEETTAMLNKVQAPFTVIKDFKSLKDFQILISAPDNPPIGPEVVAWVEKGGKLISFAQKFVPNALPQKIRATGRYGFFTELILKTHPVLKGLEQSDFRYWNGDRSKIFNKWLVTRCLLPLNHGVIASLMTTGNRMGMSIAEYRLGKGICFLSQIEAVERFGTDSVATKYLLNVLNYCLLDWSAPDAPMLTASLKKLAAFKVDPKKAFFIDIAKECTMGFTDEVKGDKKGGWTDQGPNLDLHNFPLGKQTFNGVPFDIINPAVNNGKSCIVLRGSKKTNTEFLPLKKRITINRKAQKLYFLVSSAWCVKQREGSIANLKISEEADGTEMFSFHQIDWIPGKNIADWWNAAASQPPEAEMGWIGLTGKGLRNYEVGTFILEWTNPTPKKIIQYIDFTSTEKSIPIVLGITGVE